MKKLYYFIICLGTLASKTQAQSINFDNWVSAINNDYTNNFTGSKYTQMQTGGITGGMLLAGQSYSDALYNKNLIVGSTVSTVSIMFKYNSALYSGPDDAASISIKDVAGGNLIEFMTGNSGATIHTTGGTNSSYTAAFSGGWLRSGNWYMLLSKFYLNSSNNLVASTQVFECGSDGFATPQIIGSWSNQDLGFGLITGTVKITVGSHRQAGSETIDNFVVSGQSSTGVASHQLENAITLPTYLAGSKIHVAASLNDQINYCILDVKGSTILKGSFRNTTDIDCSGFPSGNYLIRFLYGNAMITRKFVKQ